MKPTDMAGFWEVNGIAAKLEWPLCLTCGK